MLNNLSCLTNGKKNEKLYFIDNSFYCACTTPTPINVSVESAVNEDIDVDQYNKCYILNEDKIYLKKIHTSGRPFRIRYSF